jgi:dTDP-4-amino-4,6-dideoxygalactose transaminase
LTPYYNIPFHQAVLAAGEIGDIECAVSSGLWTTISEESRKFFDQYYPSSPCFFTNSCSSALEMAIQALGIGAGDEVIIPGFGYVALANAVVNNGATPVFADVTWPDGNIDVHGVETCISQRTKAVIALHYAGNPCEISSLMTLCENKGIYLIEDAAQCIGSTYDGEPLGEFGHIGCLSFDYMKNISCGQGGLLIVNDKTLLPKVQVIYDNGTNRQDLIKGTLSQFEWVGKGVNCQMNPIASYFLGAQLRSLKDLTDNRVAKWNMYYESLSGLADNGKFILNKPKPTHNGHIFYLITGSEDERKDLRDHLRGIGIFSEHHYSSLAESIYGKQVTSLSTSPENSEKLCKRLLRLPMWNQITDDQIKTVSAEITAFYS